MSKYYDVIYMGNFRITFECEDVGEWNDEAARQVGIAFVLENEQYLDWWDMDGEAKLDIWPTGTAYDNWKTVLITHDDIAVIRSIPSDN